MAIEIDDPQRQIQLYNQLKLLMDEENFDKIKRFFENTHYDINYYQDERNLVLYSLRHNYHFSNKARSKMMELLLENKARFDVRLENGVIPLFEVARCCPCSILELIFKTKANIYMNNDRHQNMLMYAFEGKAVSAVIQMLLTYDFDLNQQDIDGRTIYMYAFDKYSIFYVKSMTYVMDRVVIDSEAIVQLILAGRNKKAMSSTKIQNLLNYSGKKMYLTDKNGETALIHAARNCPMDVIKFCVNCGSNINQLDVNGNSILSLCLEKREAFDYIISLNPDLTLKNKLNQTPLIIACIKNNNYAARYLISKLDEDTLNAFDNTNNSAIHYMVKNCNSPLVSYLSMFNVDLNLKNGDGDTPLILACKNKCYEITKYLVNKNVDLSLRNLKDESAIYIAIVNGLNDYIDILLDKLVNANETYDVENDKGNKKNVTLLMLACQYQRINAVKKLLAKGAFVDLVDDEGYNALMYAIKSHTSSLGNMEIVSLLLKHKAEVNVTAKDGSTPFILACNCEDDSIANELLKYPVQIDVKDHEGRSPNISSLIHGHSKLFNALIKKNPDTDDFINPDVVEMVKSKFFEALTNNKPNVVSTILSAAFMNVIKIDFLNGEIMDQIVAHLKNSISQGNIEIVQIIIYSPLLNKTNIKRRILNGRSLGLAIANGQTKLVDFLIRQSIDINEIDEFGNTPLLIAVKRRYPDVVEKLMSLKADVTITNRFGETPLTEAPGMFITSNSILEAQYLKIVKKMIKNGASVDAQTQEGQTTLMNACFNGSPSLVKQILKYQPNLNLTNSFGLTALTIAVKQNYLNIVEMLLKKGADTNIPDEDGNTPLIYAIRANSFTLVKAILNNKKCKCDVTIENNLGESAQMIATAFDNSEIIKILSKY